MSLAAACDQFQTQVEALDPDADLDYSVELRRLILKVAKDAAAHVADYSLGEIPALLQSCHQVLAWLKSEAEDPEDRQRRYQRQRAVLDLLVLCEGVVRFHAGKKKPADVDVVRGRVADALQPLVPAERTE